MTKKITIAILLILIIGVTLFFLLTGKKDSLLWTYHNGKQTVSIYGFLDHSHKSMYPLPEKVQKAFDQAEVLVVQSIYDNSEINAIKNLTSKKGLFNGRLTIKDQISKETYQEFEKAFSEFKIPFKNLEKYKIWNIAYNYLGRLANKNRVKNIMPYIYYFKNKGSNKEFYRLEPSYILMQTLSRLHVKEQTNYAKFVIRNANTKEKIDKLFSFAGEVELDSLTHYLVDRYNSKELKTYYQRYYLARNKKLAEEIKKIIDEKKDKNIFIVLNLENLLGNEGVLEQLQKQDLKFK